MGRSLPPLRIQFLGISYLHVIPVKMIFLRGTIHLSKRRRPSTGQQLYRE
nr:MAG TPA: hypothetical protein [Caudoviricetes sp.]